MRVHEKWNTNEMNNGTVQRGSKILTIQYNTIQYNAMQCILYSKIECDIFYQFNYKNKPTKNPNKELKIKQISLFNIFKYQ